ncbi:TPA: fimbria/pilus outer membrane usher protein, partial [Providencia alcalifaciens]
AFESQAQLPGVYQVDIVLNGQFIETSDLSFDNKRNDKGELVLKTCLTEDMLARYGVKVKDYPYLFNKNNIDKESDKHCANLSEIPSAVEYFDFYNQQLKLSIPQEALAPSLSGIAPEKLWDDGINAFIMSYQVDAINTRYRNSSDTSSLWARIEPGLNIGAWRVRNLTTWNKDKGEQGKSENVYTYAERGLPSIKSRLLVGESYTNPSIFDSVPFRGVMLSSDESMVPYTQYAFAPVIRGIAQSQARIEIRQNGYLIYSISVVPGPFSLTDIPVTGSGGDLQVTVLETNGQNQVFTVPYTTPAIALREGYLKYNIAGGQYRSPYSSVEHANLVQLTAMYGLPWNLTSFIGFQGAEHYHSIATGFGVSMGDLGAISIDGIYSQGQKQKQNTEYGYLWQTKYTKTFNEIGTSFIAASNQYSSSNYNTISDVLDTYDNDSSHGYHSDNRRSRRTSLSLSQSLGEWGYLNFTGNRDEYRGGKSDQDTLNVSYTKNWEWGTLSFNWSENKNSTGFKENKENIISTWLSIPLDRWLGTTNNDISATAQFQKASRENTRYETGLNGRAFDKQLYWNVGQQFTPGSDNHDNNGRLNLAWYGTYGELRGGYSYSESAQRMNAGLSGTMVVHNKGITFSQKQGGAMALVEAPGADGVKVNGWPGMKTDFLGYTTIGYLNPYQTNQIALDPVTFPENAEVPQTDIKVVPTKGAIVRARFKTNVGQKALFKLTQVNGKNVPFGAVVSILGDSGENRTGIVNENGEVYMTGLSLNGQLNVKWNSHSQCSASYILPNKKGYADLFNIQAICR